MSMTDKELAEIEERYKRAQQGPVFVPSEIARAADQVPKLIAEVRRLKLVHPVGCAQAGAMLKDELDRLVDQRDDWKQKAEHNLRVAEQFRDDFERAVAQRDELAALLAAANEREQLLIGTSNTAREMAATRFDAIDIVLKYPGLRKFLGSELYDRLENSISEPKPVPMCKPDPLEDIMPPTEGGRP